MTAAPTPTIDASGVATWIDDPACTGGYQLFGCFDSGYANWSTGNVVTVGVGVTTYDSFASNWTGGQRIGICGLDSDNNIVRAPSFSVGYLTKNQ